MASVAAPVQGVLLLDKPVGFTSTQALGRAKRFLQLRKAGHTGTLDPFATGLLPVVFGEATKFSRFLLDATKTYEATLRLGEVTPSGDTETEVVQRRPVVVDDAEIADVLARFTGVQAQIPPMHSAVRVDGKRLYEHARRGIEIERDARTIDVVRLEALRRDDRDLEVRVTCSKGTYVRTLGVDIGEALGCGAHLVALRRTAIGSIGIENAIRIADLEANGVEWSRSRLLPIDMLVAALPRWDVSTEQAVRFAQGQELPDPPGAGEEDIAVYAPSGRLVGVGRRAPSGRLAPSRLMAVPNPREPDFS